MVALRYESPLRLLTGYQNPISIIISVSVNYSIRRILSPIEIKVICQPKRLCESIICQCTGTMPIHWHLHCHSLQLASERAACNAIPWKRMLIKKTTIEPVARASNSQFSKQSGLKLWMSNFTMRMNRRCLLYTGINCTVVLAGKIKLTLIVWFEIFIGAQPRGGRSMNPPLIVDTCTKMCWLLNCMWVSGLQSRIHRIWVL